MKSLHGITYGPEHPTFWDALDRQDMTHWGKLLCAFVVSTNPKAAYAIMARVLICMARVLVVVTECYEWGRRSLASKKCQLAL